MVGALLLPAGAALGQVDLSNGLTDGSGATSRLLLGALTIAEVRCDL